MPPSTHSYTNAPMYPAKSIENEPATHVKLLYDSHGAALAPPFSLAMRQPDRPSNVPSACARQGKGWAAGRLDRSRSYPLARSAERGGEL